MRGAEFPFTHNLALLLQLCADAGIDVPAELDEADLLTPCAVQIRYGTAIAGHVDREARSSGPPRPRAGRARCSHRNE